MNQFNMIDTTNDVIVVPGEEVTNTVNTKNNEKVILGPGLRRVADKILVCNSGVLKKKGNHTYWVDSHRKRYIPVKGELIVGIVVAKAGDVFKIDIGSSEQATLSYLAFEGSTKKNRPRLEIGDVIYAKVLDANRDMEPELVCMTSSGKSDVMSILPNDGFMFSCSLNLARKLRKQYASIFDELGKVIPYEIAIGLNGRIWIRSKTVKATIAIGNIILTSEFLQFKEVQDLCRELINKRCLL